MLYDMISGGEKSKEIYESGGPVHRTGRARAISTARLCHL